MPSQEKTECRKSLLSLLQEWQRGKSGYGVVTWREERDEFIEAVMNRFCKVLKLLEEI